MGGPPGRFPPCAARAQVPSLPPDLEGKARVKSWISRLAAKPAHYELGADETRQLEYDIATSFNEFNDCL